MVELCNEGQPVDLITLQNRLKEKELPPDISSMEYVRDLIAAVPTSANVKYYANIVSEKAVLRRLIRTTEEVANACIWKRTVRKPYLRNPRKSCLIFCREQMAAIMCRSAGCVECSQQY